MIENLAPFGIDWASIPVAGVSVAANTAALWDLCMVASNSIDLEANMPLRATVDVETLMGPDARLAIMNSTGVAMCLMAHWPVLSAVGAQWTTTGGYPQTFNSIPTNMMSVGEPSVSFVGGTSIPGGAGDGMNEIMIAPGYVSWGAGRNGYTVQIGYINGWPHAGLDESASADATSIHVDDVTAFTGTRPMLWDAGNTELLNVTNAVADTPITVLGNTVEAGPGTLTLATGLQYAHTYTAPGPCSCVVTAVPDAVRMAGYYFAAAEAMQRGTTQISVPVLPGGMTTTGSIDSKVMFNIGCRMVKPFARVY